MDRVPTMSGQEGAGGVQYPVDNATYNLLQTLTSKLEALDAYQKYEQDAQGEEASLYRELADNDRQQAKRILELIQQRFSGG